VGLERGKQRLLVTIGKLVAQSKKVSVTWAEKIDPKLASGLVLEKMSWATAMWSIWNCKTR